MNKLCCLIGMFFTCSIGWGQNLVPNGDFEQYSGCPSYFAQLDSSLFWINPTTNIFGVSGTPDYFHQCSSSSYLTVPYNNWGYQIAHSGQAYCGLGLFLSSILDFREYVEGEFISPLVADTCYQFEFYVSKGNICREATDAIGVYFSNTLINGINNYYPLPFTPQLNNTPGNYITDTLSWTLFSWSYVAAGGEKYFIIGNFKNDANTNTILINSGTASFDGYIYIDDVSLIQVPYTNSEINFYPNPFSDKLNITAKTNELVKFVLYDVTGRKTLQQSFSNSISINTERLAKGIYLYEVRSKNGVIKKGKVVKD